MRTLLFEWTSGGHHELYLRRFAEALAPVSEVVVAAPGRSALGTHAEAVDLGDPRPALDFDRPLGPQHAALAERELNLLDQAIGRARADQVVHLYADPVIRRLVRRPPLPVPLTLCVFFPRAHYPSAFGSPLGPRERARALLLEHFVRRFRRRSDARAVMTLDEEAAARWARGRGAPAHWLPEPPVQVPTGPPLAEEREGCVVYGELAERKGISLLAAAIALEPTSLRVVLAGSPDPSYLEELRRQADRMCSAGARVELRARHHEPEEGLQALARARCAVLPYPCHYGMSRVLVEAAAVGTPVVAHERGLIGHLVRRYGLGQAIDCVDPAALRRAILSFSEDPSAGLRLRAALERFSARYATENFERQLCAALAVPTDVQPRPATGRTA